MPVVIMPVVIMMATIATTAGVPPASAAPAAGGARAVAAAARPGAAITGPRAPGPRAPGPQAKAGQPRPEDNSGGQQQCFYQVPACASYNPTASFEIVSIGDTSGCPETLQVTWGDGASTTQGYTGGPNGAVLTTASHAYSKPGSYGLSVSWSSSSLGCANGGGSLTFTYLSPPTPAEQGGAGDPSEKPANCSASPTNNWPVNCATGVFWHTFTDLSIPGRGVPLDFTRTYESSRASTSGPFGYGWTDSYGMTLTTDSAGDVTVNQEDGATVTFSPSGSGGYTAPSRVEATLARNADGSYTFTRTRARSATGSPRRANSPARPTTTAT